LDRAGNLPWEEAIPSFFAPQAGEMFAALGFSAQVSARLGDEWRTTEPYKANDVAWCCALCPAAVRDTEGPIRLAEFALAGFSPELKYFALRTLGASLYRAGRFEDAIRRLEEGNKIRNGAGDPQDWVFLAMAHHRLGHRDEARLWLDKLRLREANTGPDQFWNELEIRLLRSEAEAVVIYDPIFPADPFAR
jgi:tetratricopeptide (TPR) repeat protein